MITLITGAPGAGKTNALVSLLAELAEGRALYVSGIPDLSVPHVVLDDPTKWHEVVEDEKNRGSQYERRSHGPAEGYAIGDGWNPACRV